MPEQTSRIPQTIKDLWFVWVILSIALSLGIVLINDQVTRHHNAEDALAKLLEKVGCDDLEDNIIVHAMYYNQKNIVLKDSQRIYDMALKKLTACGLPT